MEKDLKYYKENAEEDYLTTPISVLKYITELESEVGVKSKIKELQEWIKNNNFEPKDQEQQKEYDSKVKEFRNLFEKTAQ